MAKRTKSGTEQLQEHVDTCVKEYTHWKSLRTDGGTDPNWSDGVNLNLVRTHIICAKGQIRRTCDKFKLVIPAIYFKALPPVMSNDFFVTDGKNYNPKRVERIKNLRGQESVKIASESDAKSELHKTAPAQLTLF